MVVIQSQRTRGTICGAGAVVTFYPDSRIGRFCAEGCRSFEEIRWHLGWDALLEAIECTNVENGDATPAIAAP